MFPFCFSGVLTSNNFSGIMILVDFLKNRTISIDFLSSLWYNRYMNSEINEAQLVEIEDLKDKIVDLQAQLSRFDEDKSWMERYFELTLENQKQESDFINMMVAVVKATGGQLTIPNVVWLEMKTTDQLVRFENTEGDIVFKVAKGEPNVE